MAAPSYTYTLTNGTTADASQVQQNFTDIRNGVTDSTKDLSISALTCAGSVTFNGNVTLGNASGDDITFEFPANDASISGLAITMAGTLK